MGMEHKYIVDEGIIENYLLHRLNERETDDFEEHLLFCKECRNQLAETKEILTLTQYMAIHTPGSETRKDDTKKGAIPYRRWMKAAAVLLFAVCSAGIIWSLLQKPTVTLVSTESNSDTVKNIRDSLPIDGNQSKEILSQNVVPVKKELLSDNYKEHPLYENAIRNNLRGESIKILSPERSKRIKFGEEVVFSFKDYKSEFLLSVINNEGKTIFEKAVKIPFILPLELPKGLYYWEITENDEVVFVSKFLII
jgi:hypothetical protein